jgi:predicted ATPase/DNA-binding CsgD family transcriptional regulator
MVAVPFVGRVSESAALDEGLADACSGRGRLVLVAGEPGIGKSRLASELTARARARGAQVAWGRCWEAGGAPAYWPWTEVVATLVDRFGVAELRERLGPLADDIGQIVPALRATGTEEHRSPDSARFRLFDAVVQLCRSATADVPMVAVLDDVQVADQPSLLLLQFLAGQLEDIGLLLIATYRDTEPAAEGFSDVLGQLVRERSTTRLRLRGLGDDGVAQLIGAATRVGPSPRLVARVRELTDGNPLYVGEAVRLLAAEGALGHEADLDRLVIPKDVRETVLRRLAHLSERCREVLVRASVLGRDFPLDLLTAFAGADADVIAALDEAEAAAVVVDSPGRPGCLQFAHAVISEALYGEIPSLRRRRLHHEASAAIESQRAHDLEPHLAELARHCYASLPVGPADRAVGYARRAGRRAVEQLAYEEGARLYGRALTAADGAGATASPAERADLLLALGDAEAKAGDSAASKATFLEAADLARRSHDPERLARAALGYGGRFVWLRAGTDTKVIPLLREALAALPDDDSQLRVRLLARLAGALRDEPSLARRDDLSAEAVAMAARIDDPATSAYALISRTMAICGPRAAGQLLGLATRAAELAEEANELDHAAAARLLRLEAMLVTGPGEQVRRALDEYTRAADELRQPSHRWYSGVLRTVVLLLEGRLDNAERLIAETFAAGQRAQSWDAGAAHLLALAMLRWEQGRLGELEDELVGAWSEYPGYRLFRCLLALLCLETGRPDDARSLAADLLAGGDETLPLDNGWLFGMTVLAEIVARVDDRELAAAIHDRLVPFRHLVGSGGGEVLSGSAHRPIGQMLSVLGRHDEALAELAAAGEVHRRFRADLWAAHTDLDEAAVRLRRGHEDDRRRAAALVQRGAEVGRRSGWTALAARFEQLRASLERPRRTSDQRNELTRRELEVAEHVARGRSNREIARAFVLSERTVETHVQHILTKLAFTSRAEIAAWAVRSGLLDDTGP